MGLFSKKKKAPSEAQDGENRQPDEQTEGKSKPTKVPLTVLGDANALSRSSVFSAKEIKKLQKRFYNVMDSMDNCVSSRAILKMPEFRLNHLLPRVLQVQTQNALRINFNGFLSFLEILSVKAEYQKKEDVLFQVYDVDGDGIISKQDLYAATSKSMALPISSIEWKKICDTAIDEFLAKYVPEDTTLDSQRGLSREHFLKFITKSQVLRYMTIQL